MPFRRRALVIEVHAFIRKAFSMSVLTSLEKCGDGKDIDVLWNVVFVICITYEVWEIWRLKDSKNVRL